MSGAVTAVRPNGKPYTRRVKPTVLAEFDLADAPWDVRAMAYVLRTHDVDEAVALISAHPYIGCDELPSPIPAPTLAWVREKVCMCSYDHSFDIEYDPVRGVPAVYFEWRYSR